MKFRICVLIVALTLSACAHHNPAIVVGQSGLAVAKSIGTLQDATKALTGPVIPASVALSIQERLVAANDRLRPLPDILRTIDRLQQAGQSAGTEVDKAIAILTVAGQDISIVLAGVPLSTETRALIDAVTTAQKVVQSLLIEVARIKGVN